ncbi:unnamed protein product, partial [Scytosiphon promiscuus]
TYPAAAAASSAAAAGTAPSPPFTPFESLSAKATVPLRSSHAPSETPGDDAVGHNIADGALGHPSSSKADEEVELTSVTNARALKRQGPGKKPKGRAASEPSADGARSTAPREEAAAAVTAASKNKSTTKGNTTTAAAAAAAAPSPAASPGVPASPAVST